MKTLDASLSRHADRFAHLDLCEIDEALIDPGLAAEFWLRKHHLAAELPYR
ncbi:MAG TPA: hypothetical protein VHU89_00890 [Acidobacteriaceae bacterium]|nr:hypothetical protein [Acidobacteriaceae bacterium]